ncbi:MAG: hypothetical protein DMD42_12735 [Gemmatimonadetes bacterium]|nr:MAG: hypothetical protein DMD42_12735 [Gemmatimonadota bacterium]
MAAAGMVGVGSGGTLSARGSRATWVLESARRRAQRSECRARSVLGRRRGRGSRGAGRRTGARRVRRAARAPAPCATHDDQRECRRCGQYAYGQHGIRLPRMSRDQARAGAEVTPLIDALRPGDILLFSARPGAGVTHVGMYVGELKFIHSSNRGVKLSRLDPQDPEGAYWLDRWVGARRVIP